MKGLIQRVSSAKVQANGTLRGGIANGLVLFLAIEADDGEQTADKLLHKVLRYRVFEDEAGKMNKSLLDCQAGLVIVSQFTLVADTKRGLRPSFSRAGDPFKSEWLYEYFIAQAAGQVPNLVTGIFGADMLVEICNRGPATFMLSS